MTTYETLEKIGLSKGEAKIYLALLRRGKLKPSELAKQTGISRPMVYNFSKNLLSKGIISEDISGKVLYFSPLPPANLEHLIRTIKEDAHQKERMIRKAIGELSLISADKQYPVPRIRFIEEHDLKKFLFDNLTKWQDAVLTTPDGIWWGYQDATFVEHFESWIHASWQTPQGKDPRFKGWVFTNASKTEQKLQQKYGKPRRHVRTLGGTNFTGSMWVCGEYLVLIMTQHRPFYLVEINDELQAHNTAEIFKKLWISEKD